MVLSRWGTKCYWCRGTFPSCKKKSWSKRCWMSEDFPGYYSKQFRILNASSALVVNCLQWTRCLKFSSTSLLCGEWSWILLHFCSHFFAMLKIILSKLSLLFSKNYVCRKSSKNKVLSSLFFILEQNNIICQCGPHLNSSCFSTLAHLFHFML